VYGPPVYQPYPVVYGQPWQQPEPDPEPEPPVAGGQAMRAVLILAAVAGVVTVVVGLLFMLSAPAEYGLGSDRTALNLRVQPTATGASNAGALSELDPTAAAPVPTLPPAPPMQPSTPKRLVIPKIGVNAPITSVGTDKTGAIQVPPIGNPNLVGWYRYGPTAGESGPAVMLGHKDTTSRSAVFSRLYELRNGDTVEVTRMDGTVAIFTVGGIEQAGKTTFPTSRVYGDSAAAELRLITCGGTYNRNTGHYTDNIIVYATMTGTRLAK
jgi:LPXTG-site transpeptidase (sortase) family protein